MKYSQPLLIIILLLASIVSYEQAIVLEHDNMNETKTTLDVYSARIASIIDGTINVTEIIKELVLLHNGDAPLDEIKRLSKVLFNEQIHINVSYAPDGVIEYSYPLEGNEESIGHRLLDDPITRGDALKAMQQKKATLSKPYILRQGMLAAVVRDPIYIVKDGKEVFWGFVAVAMKTSEGLIIHSDIGSLEKFGYEYTLSYYYNDTEEVDILKSSHFDSSVESISKAFYTTYGVWELEMYRNISLEEKVVHFLSLTLLCTAVIITFVYIIASIKRRKTTPTNAM